MNDTANARLPWWVMLIAYPGIAAAVILGPMRLHGASGQTLALAGAGLAAYLGLHTDPPGWLLRSPVGAKLAALASGGLILKLCLFLPLITDARWQAGLWLAVAVLSYLAGKPLTVGLRGQALPADLVQGDKP